MSITLSKNVNFSLKEKSATLNLEFSTMAVRCFLVFFIFCASVQSVVAQNPENRVRAPENVLGRQQLDSLRENDQNRAIVADTVNNDSLVVQAPRSDIETTINYSARDSINLSVDSKVIKLYGNAKITYGTIELDADRIIIDYNLNTLTAYGRLDSTGQRIGYPIFKNGTEIYETKEITYNFKTGRARITEVVTQQNEGFLHGETVYKNSKDELFSINNTYTTCNLAHPHYQIRAKRIKAIPDDKVVSGPFNLEINDVPTPLGFAFGMFPDQKEASSGIIVPSFGEERRRGFKLENGGYFFDISEYIKLTLTGSIYSKGGYAINANSNYRKRYKHNGSLNFAFTKLRASENIEDESVQNDFRLTWSHTPQSKGSSRFSASVNAATASYNQNNYLGVNSYDPSNLSNNAIDNTTRKLSSNISYSKTFQGTPFSLAISARHNQDVGPREIGGGQVDLLLPSLTFNMSNIYPFRGKSGGNSWTDKITLRYSLVGSNNLTNNLGRIGSDPTIDSIAPFTIENMSTFLKNSNKGFRHQIPLSTSFRFLKHFTASPSINYEERWYFDKLNWEIDPENPNRAIISDTIPGFNRVYNYSAGISFATRLYGTVKFKKGNIQAIRHVMNPSVSVNYQPDFGADNYDYYQRLTTEDGRELVQSRYQGYLYGTPSVGEIGSISFSLSNTLEAKVKTKKDTSDIPRKVPILNNFGFNTGYNFVADSFNLANISWRANTTIFKGKLNINLSGAIDPYVYRLDSTSYNSRDELIVYQRRVNEYAWNNGNGIGQLSNATLALSTNFNPKAREKDEDTRERIMNSNISDAEKDFMINNPDYYIDFNIPWTFRVNYNLRYTKRGFEEAKLIQSIRFSGDFALTEKWKITFNSGYDFEQSQFTQTNIGIARDLHCWEMNINWTPFGFYQSYNFTIRVKSSILQDLKLNRTRTFYDR